VLKIDRNQFGNGGLIFDDENAAGHRHLLTFMRWVN
jgi:hypothetical protein